MRSVCLIICLFSVRYACGYKGNKQLIWEMHSLPEQLRGGQNPRGNGSLRRNFASENLVGGASPRGRASCFGKKRQRDGFLHRLFASLQVLPELSDKRKVRNGV